MRRNIALNAGHDQRLLQLFAETFGTQGFDASSIAGEVSLEELRLLGFPGLHARRRSPAYRLTAASMARLRHWFDRVEGRAIGGYLLERDRLGWCHVHQIENCDGKGRP
jgi:hypothetical protein